MDVVALKQFCPPPQVFINYPFVDLLGPPIITHVSDNQTANERDKVVLNCTADGNPPPNITWTRLSSESRVTFPLTVGRLDEGGYRCTADNGIAIKTHDVFITVQCEWNWSTTHAGVERIVVLQLKKLRYCHFFLRNTYMCLTPWAQPWKREVNDLHMYAKQV